jgi:tRNA 2-thiouridine synthesizing protein D
MNVSLLILSEPYSSQSSLSALKYAKAALLAGHSIPRVFFYHNGVHTGSQLQTPQQDESNIQQEWVELANEYKLDLVICIAAALKRGNLTADEANRYDRQQHNIEAPFELSGLGQLLDAQLNSDQMITFA